MADRQKLIAVCLSQVHNFLNTGFLNELSRVAEEDGYGVVVINTSLDFYWFQSDNKVPRAGYRALQYHLFDALFIICHSFHDDNLIRELVAGAQAQGIPVILAGMELPGCWSVINEYEEAYKELLRHVIRDHGARDTYYIAGMRDEPNSEGRVRCWREVLGEFSLPWSPGMLAYGNYWAKPAAEIVHKLICTRETLPDAIFCANDVMAIAVCDALREEGFRVPEDVIVTGFDSSPSAYMVRPRLTTCGDNPHSLAVKTMDLLRRIRAGEQPPYIIRHSFRSVLSQSCGCPSSGDDRYDALSVYRRSERLSSHENDLYHTVTRLLVQKEPESFLKMISASILPDSYICLNKRFLGIYSGMDYTADCIEEELLMIPYRDAEQDLAVTECKLSELRAPEGLETGISLFNTIHTGSVVCGFYAAHTRDLDSDAQLIKRLSDVLNLVFTIHLGNARQQLLIHHLDSTLYLDSATGLNNLKGLTRWFEKYSAEDANRFRPLALSVYCIHRYNYIYENYGMNETEEIVNLVANRLTSANPNALIIARISGDQFVVMDSGENSEAIGRTINRTTEDFFTQIESYNAISSRPYYIEVNCGCTTVDGGWKDTALENLIKLALGELYLNRMRSNIHTAAKSSSTAELYSTFNLLMEKNLFKFHFQPIVNAKSAQIYAYEALMRTDNLINLTPLEVLSIAREYNRLYDVEKATLFGIMDRFVNHYSEFFGSKVFINTIPGHFLNEEDCAAIREEFDNYLDCFVFELTEQDSIEDEELLRLKSLCKTGSTAQLAIDDYGTGHSNIVNVLRYSPQIIKIDRALISGIQNDRNKQLFVRNTIEFAHQNGIKALAEGVETSEELRTVIDYGIDLIQGYYTGRPSEVPATAVHESVRHEILAENLMLTRYNRDAKVYVASDGDVIDLLALAMDHYTCVRISGGHVTVTGQKTQSVDMLFLMEDNTEAALTFRDVNLKGVNETPVQLGNRCRLTLIVEGSNTLNKEGVRVPASSFLTLLGSGELMILNNRNYSVGIGSNYNDPYGTIVIDLEGALTIQSSGDKVVCIGGGRSAGEGIFILRGTLRLAANGISVIGLGSSTGDTQIEINQEASVTAIIDGNDSLGIGSLSGQALLRSAGDLDITVNCERATGIGSMNGTGEFVLEGGEVSVTVHCDAGTCIGTFTGEVTTLIRDARVRIHGEGNRVAGLGSTDGACDTRIESGDVAGTVLAGERMIIGNKHSRVIITGGNVAIFPENNQVPVSPAGAPLHCMTPAEDHFEQECKDKRSAWTYVADRNKENQLYVWLP